VQGIRQALCAHRPRARPPLQAPPRANCTLLLLRLRLPVRRLPTAVGAGMLRPRAWRWCFCARRPRRVRECRGARCSHQAHCRTAGGERHADARPARDRRRACRRGRADSGPCAGAARGGRARGRRVGAGRGCRRRRCGGRRRRRRGGGARAAGGRGSAGQRRAAHRLHPGNHQGSDQGAQRRA